MSQSERAELVAAEPAQIGLYPSEPQAMVATVVEQAEVLAEIIEKKKLFVEIGRGDKKKKYVQVEGWTTLGAMLGIFPAVAWTRETADFQPYIERVTWSKKNNRNVKDVQVIQEGQGSIIARVECTHVASGNLIGAAEAECGYGEDQWKARDAYSLRSMAQTRATSKALRVPLGFVMALAGYEATPSDEFNTDHVVAGKKILYTRILGAEKGDEAAKEEATKLWTEAKEAIGVAEVDDEQLTPAQVEEILESIRETRGGEE